MEYCSHNRTGIDISDSGDSSYNSGSSYRSDRSDSGDSGGSSYTSDGGDISRRSDNINRQNSRIVS